MKSIAIIGAGISGLVLGNALKNKAKITLFEKARGVGGRMSTRYADPYYFDHGAQCFTARTPEFQAFLAPFMETGVVAEWKGKVVNLEIGKKETKRLWFEPHLVASPNMNSLCKVLAKDLDIRSGMEVAPLSVRAEDKWVLQDTKENTLGEYDVVISTAPPAQTMNLFHGYLTTESIIHDAKMQGCVSLMVGFNKPWDKRIIAAKVRNNPIKWISINSSKPGRDTQVTCYVAHSRSHWAEVHMETEMQVVQEILYREFVAVTGIDATPDYLSAHRWRYALVEDSPESGVYYDAKLGLAATSDWCSTSRIEDVWWNASRLLAQIHP